MLVFTKLFLLDGSDFFGFFAFIGGEIGGLPYDLSSSVFVATDWAFVQVGWLVFNILKLIEKHFLIPG